MKSLGQKKFKDKSPEEVNKILSDAWLNIVVDENKIFNPITNIPEFISDKPHLYYTWLMMQPEYFSFLASEILNVNILPFQSVILSELWNRKFPMLIGSRGLSKALLPETPVLSEDGWKPIIEIKTGERVYSRDGKLCNVLASTGRMKDLNSFKVSFEDGREIICCEDHSWFVTEDIFPLDQTSFYKSIDTKTLYQIIKDKKNQKIFSVPLNDPVEMGKESHFETHPYLMGLILGSGYHIGEKIFLTIFSPKVKEKLKELNIELELVSESESKYSIKAPNSPIREYEQAPLKDRLAFMDGLLSQVSLDSAGNSIIHHNHEFTSTIASIARSCGFFCLHKQYKKANSKLVINKKKSCRITDIQAIGKNEGCCIEVDSKDNTYITKDFLVTHNSFLMGLYSLIRAFLMPRRKIVICGAAFRQSKVVYEYAANIWHNSPLLRDIIGTSGNNGPRNMTDMCRLTLKDSMISALPIGTGDKIRGQRASDILSDEFSSIPRDIFETVIAGFAAVSADPANNVRESAKKKMQELMGLEMDEEEDTIYSKTNQIAISGTAYYDFNHFATYWKKWHNIIASKGDTKKLSQVFDGEIPEHFNWKDYSIMRIPYNLLPYGFMDQGQLARSKATVHSGIFLMEFSACSHPDTPIITDKGIKKIIDVNIGDLVLTHKGRFRKVIKRTFRDYDGYLINLEANGHKISFTPEHPFWISGDTFEEIRHFGDILSLAGEKKSNINLSKKYTLPYKGYVYNLEVEEDHSYSTPVATVHNCFAKDSNGFFRRSLIESCTISADKSITIDGKEVIFDAVIKGDTKQKYVYAVDPASESDNLSIVILEIRPNHRRVVYCWTTNRKQHIEKVKAKIVSETDFYSYCAKKIRELMKTFTPERIAIDSQGGGVAIIEALHDADKIAHDEVPLWEIIESGKSKPSDVEQGLHIIEKINFASAEFTSGSNHGLRKDMEDKIILFPFFNAAALSASLEDDNAHNRVYDTLEDCMMEIEEMKNELTTIVVTQTSGGREHWDTPEVKLPGMKKGKLRKDRYSSLLMANYSARNLDRAPKPIDYETTGGFAESNNKNKETGVSYIGTPWLAGAMNGLYD